MVRSNSKSNIKSNTMLVIAGLSMITLSACAPRSSVTQAVANQANATGVSGQPLYQTASLANNVPSNVISQPLPLSMMPIASNTVSPNVDYTATGSIDTAAYKNPMAITNYNASSAITPNTYSPSPASKAEIAYTVQPSDTIYSIGRKFNVHPGEIIARNGISAPDNLIVGQSFMIPTNGNYTASTQSVPVFPKSVNNISEVSQTYTVQQGDTMYSIGRKFNVHPNYIISKNPSVNPSQLAPGQVLNITANTNTSSNNAVNTVKTVNTAKAETTPIQTPKPENKIVLPATTVVANNNSSIMGETNKSDNLEKEILSNALTLPVKGAIKENKNLRGILISAGDGDAVKASAAGEVIYVGNLNNYGNMVLVRHDNGLVTNYARLKKTFVQKGQKVNKGDLIASAGTSKDFATSDVLFEVRKGTKAVNPLDYIG